MVTVSSFPFPFLKSLWSLFSFPFPSHISLTSLISREKFGSQVHLSLPLSLQFVTPSSNPWKNCDHFHLVAVPTPSPYRFIIPSISHPLKFVVDVLSLPFPSHFTSCMQDSHFSLHSSHRLSNLSVVYGTVFPDLVNKPNEFWTCLCHSPSLSSLLQMTGSCTLLKLYVQSRVIPSGSDMPLVSPPSVLNSFVVMFRQCSVMCFKARRFAPLCPGLQCLCQGVLMVIFWVMLCSFPHCVCVCVCVVAPDHGLQCVLGTPLTSYHVCLWKNTWIAQESLHVWSWRH